MWVFVKPINILIPRHAGDLRRLPQLPYEFGRPKTRSDCIDGPRPCPWMSCRHNLLIEVNEDTGGIYTTRNIEGDELPTCSLDVADEGGHDLAEVGEILGITFQATQVIESRALAKLREEHGPELREILRGYAEAQRPVSLMEEQSEDPE